MSSWYEQAEARLKAEYTQVKGQKEQAMRSARMRSLPRQWPRATPSPRA